MISLYAIILIKMKLEYHELKRNYIDYK